MPAKVAFGVIHGFVPIALFTIGAVQNIKPVLIKTGRVLKLGWREMVMHVLFPAALPEIFTGLRIGFALTLIGTLLGEMFASQRGLGYMLMNAIGLHNVDVIMAVTFLITVFAAVGQRHSDRDRPPPPSEWLGVGNSAVYSAIRQALPPRYAAAILRRHRETDAHRPVRLRPAAGSHRAAAGASARCGAAVGGAAGGGGRWRTASCATCRTCCAPGDQLVVNDTKVIPAQLSGRRLGRGAEPKIEATLIKRLDGSRWQALVKPARKLAAGDVVRFGDEGGVCFLGQLDATVEAKGEAGEVTFAFAFHGPVLDAAIAERGAVPLPPYIAARRRADERDRADYQTMFAARGGRGRGADRRAAFHARPAGARSPRAASDCTPSPCMSAPAPSCRSRPRISPTTRMHAEWGEVDAETAAALNAARAAGGRIVAVGTTSLRLLESAARDDGTIAPFAGETAHLHHAGLSLPRRRRAADQFPSAALDPVHAGRGLLRARRACKRAYAHAIAAGYRFYSYGDACLLFRAEPRMSRLRVSHRRHATARRAPGVIAHAARRGAHAGLHAGRHRRAR